MDECGEYKEREMAMQMVRLLVRGGSMQMPKLESCHHIIKIQCNAYNC